jgi:Rieske Fe-S protein
MLGDVFGLLALALIGATAVLMLLRRRILKRFKNLELIRRAHIAIAGLAGLFLVLHVAYFITYPVNLEILLGYLSATGAGGVGDGDGVPGEVQGLALFPRDAVAERDLVDGHTLRRGRAQRSLRTRGGGTRRDDIDRHLQDGAIHRKDEVGGGCKEVTSGDSTGDWLRQGLEGKIPVLYQKGPAQGKGYTSKGEALSGLRKLQKYIGYAMLLSAAAGVFLLATDGSLWILAVSHAVGLVIIVILDVLLGLMNLTGSKRIYLASLAAAFLGIVLQLGDIATAPQYNMTIAYFASYLFALPAFDILLSLQAAVMVLGLLGRGNVQFLASKRRTGKELNYSRKSFLKTMVGFAGLIGFGVILGSIKIPSASSASSPSSQAQVASASTPITNTNNLQVNSPVYFQFPAGYPNVLFKRSDGTLEAYSTLCTHVCCECSYIASSNVFYCPCHGSEFDSTGRVIRGPASTSLPRITLTVDGSGNVYPTGQNGYGPC